ncbi:hypothetical protein [Pseudomonas profundi]|uniref:hypothetical protein n=1 Tax=Pseudomonas profundi TaxID=1981513 RepID=UPI001681625C|nr:hypothetical protein [Pseudomonas profundi]
MSARSRFTSAINLIGSMTSAAMAVFVVLMMVRFPALLYTAALGLAVYFFELLMRDSAV